MAPVAACDPGCDPRQQPPDGAIVKDLVTRTSRNDVLQHRVFREPIADTERPAILSLPKWPLV